MDHSDGERSSSREQAAACQQLSLHPTYIPSVLPKHSLVPGHNMDEQTKNIFML